MLSAKEPLYQIIVASLLRNVFEVRNLSTMSLRSEAGVKILSQHSPLQASVFNPLSVLYHIVQNISVSVTNGSFNCHIRVCYRERASVFTKCPVSQYLMVISRWIIVLTDFAKSWLCCFILLKKLRLHTWFFLDEAGSQVPDGHQLISHIAP